MAFKKLKIFLFLLLTLNLCQNANSELKLTVDHVMPKSRGGEKSWTNLVTACKKCNQKKGCRTPKECGMIPICKPTRPKTSILKTTNKISDLWKNYLWE